jgi:predicted alpha/beta-fold hydrolase
LPSLKAVCAVSPVAELEMCVRALERRSNFIYQWNFVRNLKARMRRKVRHYPGAFDLSRLETVGSVRAFDAVYTAPHFGFASAEDYYHRAAAMRVVGRISIPALIITAKDDPFEPIETISDPALTSNPNVTLVITEHGGHCGFLGDPHGDDDDGYWAESAIVRFAAVNSE